MTNDLFLPNGDSYDVTPPGVLLLTADILIGDPSESTPEGRQNAALLIDGFLGAARAGGFCQGDILRTLLVRGDRTKRTIEMAKAACAAAGPTALHEVLVRLGLR